MDGLAIGTQVKVQLSDAPVFTATIVAVQESDGWYRVRPGTYGAPLWVSPRRIIGLAA